MSKTYAVFEGIRILKMSANKGELVEYIKSFSEAQRRKMILAERENPIKEVERNDEQSGSKK